MIDPFARKHTCRLVVTSERDRQLATISLHVLSKTEIKETRMDSFLIATCISSTKTAFCLSTSVALLLNESPLQYRFTGKVRKVCKRANR